MLQLMLGLIPAPLHRLLYRIADRTRRVWWRIRKPHRRSVLIVALDEGGRVLLVRHSYGRPVWTLPGGAMNRGEEPAVAAAREFREELGCGLIDLLVLDPVEFEVGGAHEQQYLCIGQIDGVPVPDRREIVAAEMADPGALPAGHASFVPQRLWRAYEALQGVQQQRAD